MEEENWTVVTEFIFLRFTSWPNLERVLFTLFLIIYLLSLVGNVLILIIVLLDSRLHSAMYFFLSNLSVVETWYATVTVPKMLANFLMEKRTISTSSCIAQYYFFFSFVATELFLLTVMAYDRYLAICKPLHYSTVMNPRTCHSLAMICWLSGFICPIFPSIFLCRISFCTNKINHFFRDADQLFRLSCSDLYSIQIVGYTLITVIIMPFVLLIMTSYLQIILTILQPSRYLRSREVKKKTFSTCASHLSVATIHFGTLIFMYVHPAVKYQSDMNKVVAVFYSVVTPLLNPVIHTLRNKDVKPAIIKTILSNKG
ncbi:olfactory receptor 5AR1-like [Calonectris borealis]|uniref:olfactory receptor 5AR1-like n=1 Tax=Calonectris borealis TaxID=1323832 RepID=UPI003F4C66EB